MPRWPEKELPTPPEVVDGDIAVNVKSLTNYTNGTLPIKNPWKLGEVRKVGRKLLKRLMQDAPDNWEIIQ